MAGGAVAAAVTVAAAAAAVAVGWTDLTTPATGSAETDMMMTGWEDSTSRIDGIGTTMTREMNEFYEKNRDGTTMTGEMNVKNGKTGKNGNGVPLNAPD